MNDFKTPPEPNEAELTDVLSHPPADDQARTRFSTGALTNLRVVATDDEIAALGRVVNDAQIRPTARTNWLLSLLADFIDHVKTIRR